MTIITYEYPTRNKTIVRQTYRCTTEQQTKHIINMVESRTEYGYKIVSIEKED